MGKKDFQIILTILIFCALVFAAWKLIQIPSIETRIENFVFSHKSYAKKIKIETYLMTSKQIETLFRNNEVSEDSLNSVINTKHLNTNLYLVIRLKNIGHNRPWGVLRCQTSDCGSCDINTGLLNRDTYQNYILPTCYTTTTLPNSLPSLKWKDIYYK